MQLEPVLKNEVQYEDPSSINSFPNCLITGLKSKPVEITAATMIPGSQAMAKLVAFQINSGYDSYGKNKGIMLQYQNQLKQLIQQHCKSCYQKILIINF